MCLSKDRKVSSVLLRKEKYIIIVFVLVFSIVKKQLGGIMTSGVFLQSTRVLVSELSIKWYNFMF